MATGIDSGTDERRYLVSRMLVAHGFSGVEVGGVDESVLGVLFALLANAQNEVAHRSETDEQRRLAENDALLAHQSLAKTKLALDSADRTNKALCLRIESLETALEDSTEKCNTAKEEASKATVTLNTSLAQFKHKQKRKEAEYTILQERLQKLTNEQNHGAKLGIRVINPSGKKMSSLSQAAVKSKSEKHEKDLFAHTIQTYEDREKQLLLETDSLKSCLYNVFTRIKAAVSNVNKATGRATTIVLSNEPHEQARFHLPFALVRDQIEELFEGLLGEIEGMTGLLVDSLQAIKEAETVKSGMVGIAETEEAVQQLQNEIAEYKLIIERQKHLIEMALDNSHEGVRQNSFLGENDLLADIEEQKLMIARRSEQLDEERRKFTEAAIRLGRERCAFEKEKEEFEDEKRFAATQKILTDMPDTPIWMKKSSAPVEKLAKTPNSPSLSTRKPSAIPPKTPTPLSISTQQQRTRAASTPTTAKPTQQRIRTPTDTIRTPSASKTASSTPAYSRIHATSSEVIAEGLTFASTPGILGVRERPGLDDGVVRGSGGGVVKSVLKKSGGGGHLVGSAGKRKVVIEEGAKENWGM